MSFFRSLGQGLNNLSERIAGPSYDYVNNIKSTDEMGLGPRGNDIIRNISGIISYVDLLVDGTGTAVKNTRPLQPGSRRNTPAGNKFFIRTAGKCRDIKTGELVDRSMYINNQPQAVINWLPTSNSISLGDGFRGYAPGLLNNIGDMNPVRMFRGFIRGTTPSCEEIKLEVITGHPGRKDTYEMVSAYLPIDEIEELRQYGSITNREANQRQIRETAINNSRQMISAFENPSARENQLRQQLNEARRRNQRRRIRRLENEYNTVRNVRLQQLRNARNILRQVEGMVNHDDYLGMETEKGWSWFQEKYKSGSLTSLDDVIDSITMQELFTIVFLCIVIYSIVLSYKKYIMK